MIAHVYVYLFNVGMMYCDVLCVLLCSMGRRILSMPYLMCPHQKCLTRSQILFISSREVAKNIKVPLRKYQIFSFQRISPKEATG